MDYKIGDYEVHLDTRELHFNGNLLKVEPLIFKLLVYMLQNPDRILTRDELIQHVWESRIISDSALNAAICTTRQTIGDTASKQKYIKTVSGSGYRFIADFSYNKQQKLVNDAAAQNALLTEPYIEPSIHDYPRHAVPDKPSLAVLNFNNIGTKEEGSLLAYGLTIEINATLARLPHFLVIARASAQLLSEQKLSSIEIGKRLGVRYLVYGSLEQVNKRIRITYSIVDAQSDTEIWSEHFDRSLDDLFQIQDEISMAIVAATDSAIEQAEIERAFLTPSNDLSAWQNYYRGLWYHQKKNDFDSAQHFLEKAIVLDSQFSRAYAGLSFNQTSRRINEATPIIDTDISLLKASEYAQQSIDYSPNEALGYMSMGRTFLYLNKVAEAIPFFDQSIALSINEPNNYSLKAQLMARLGGHHNKTNQLINKAELLNPQCEINKFTTSMVRAILMIDQEKYDDAAIFSARATDFNKSYYSVYALAAACQQLAGNTQKAQNYAKQTIKLSPNCTIDSCSRLFHCEREPREKFIKALFDAGIPRSSKQGSS